MRETGDGLPYDYTMPAIDRLTIQSDLQNVAGGSSLLKS